MLLQQLTLFSYIQEVDWLIALQPRSLHHVTCNKQHVAHSVCQVYQSKMFTSGRLDLCLQGHARPSLLHWLNNMGGLHFCSGVHTTTIVLAK